MLPPEEPTGRPPKDHRQIINDILWVLRTGAPWRDLPERYGSWKTVYSRLCRWQKDGVWGHIFVAAQERADAAGNLDWDVHYVDGTTVRAHQHAAGAKRAPVTEALGRSRGGFPTKVHIRAEGHGKLMTLALTPGQQHEATVFETLMEQGAVKRRGRGRPRLCPRRVVGDKGYSARRTRAYARRRGIRITIPRRSNEHRRGPFDKAICRTRNRVERLIGRMKQYRRLAVRYEKRAVTYRAMWVIAGTVLWLECADTP